MSLKCKLTCKYLLQTLSNPLLNSHVFETLQIKILHFTDINCKDKERSSGVKWYLHSTRDHSY